MPSKPKKLSSAEIAAFEAKRDIGAEILQSIRDMKAGKGNVLRYARLAVVKPILSWLALLHYLVLGLFLAVVGYF